MSAKHLFAAIEARTDDPIAKVILIILADTANENGYSWRSHKSIAELAEVSVATVKRKIDLLICMGYLDVENRHKDGRKISNGYTIIDPHLLRTNGKPKVEQIAQSELSDGSESRGGIAHSELGDSSERAIEPTNEPTREPTNKNNARFAAPSSAECQQYADEKGWQWDVEEFVDHYVSNGWKVGGKPMKDWKAAMRNWNRRRDQFTRTKPPTTQSATDNAMRQIERMRQQRQMTLHNREVAGWLE